MAEEKEVIILELEFDAKGAVAESTKLKKSILANEKALKDLRAETKKSGKATNLQVSELNRLEAVVKKDKAAFTSLQKSVVTADRANKASTKTVNGLRDRLSGLTAELNKTEIGSKRFRELQVETKKTSDNLKGLEKSVGDNRRSIGDYSGALQNATGNFSLFGVNVGRAVGSLAAMTGATGASTKGFKFLKLAIAGTGIGLLILAIASLAAAFKSSEAGQDKFAKLMDVIGVIVGNLSDLLANLGEAIIAAVENPQQAIKDFSNFVKENITNRFDGLLELIPQLGKAITLLFEGEFAESAKVAGNAIAKVALGVEDAVGKSAAAIAGFVEQTAKEVGEAERLADLRAKTDKLEREQLVRRSKLEADVANLRLKAKQEEDFTIAERLKFLREANTIQQELLDTDLVIAKNRAEIQRIFNTFSKSTKENLDAEAEAEAKVGEIQAARANQARAIQRELNTLSREGQALAKKINADSEKELQEAAALSMELARELADATIANIEDKAAREEALERTRFEREKIRITNTIEVSKERDALIEQLAITHLANLEKIEIGGAEIRKAREAEERLSTIELRILQDQEDLEAKILFEQAKTAIDLENTQLTNTEKEIIIEESEQKISDIKDKARKENFKKDQKSVQDLQAITQALSGFIGSLKAAELQQAGDDAEAKKQIEKDFADTEMGIRILEIVVATALAIMQAIAQLGPIAGGIAAVLVGATGAVQIGIAVSNRNKIKSLEAGGEASKSGIFKGKRHSQNGINYFGDDGSHIQVEDGELWAVMNRKSTAMIKAFSDWNALGGGVDFAEASKGGAFMQDGGIVQQFVSDPVTSQVSQTEGLIAAIRELPPSIVTVEDINAIQSQVDQIEVRATV